MSVCYSLMGSLSDLLPYLRSSLSSPTPLRYFMKLDSSIELQVATAQLWKFGPENLWSDSRHLTRLNHEKRNSWRGGLNLQRKFISGLLRKLVVGFGVVGIQLIATEKKMKPWECGDVGAHFTVEDWMHAEKYPSGDAWRNINECVAVALSINTINRCTYSALTTAQTLTKTQKCLLNWPLRSLVWRSLTKYTSLTVPYFSNSSLNVSSLRSLAPRIKTRLYESPSFLNAIFHVRVPF